MSRGRAATCVRCSRPGAKAGTTWPEGSICRRCYQRATRIHGICPKCATNRLLPGISADGSPICVDCAGITKDFHCTRCSEEDEPVRIGLCARCCLRDDLTVLLDDGTGNISAQLQPLFDALTTQNHARSARIWLTTNPDATTLLKNLATGETELTHATFLDHPRPRKVRFLRLLSTDMGLLPAYNRDIEAYETWLETKLSDTRTTEHRQLIKQYATWVHLNRMRYLAGKNELRPATILAARQSTNVALGFLSFLHDRGQSAATCEQRDVDDWLATGPTTRSSARGFVRWAIRNRHLPTVDFPYRVAKTARIIGQAERLAALRQAIDPGSTASVMDRAAIVLLLLYAQPLTRVAEMRTDQILIGPEGQVAILISEDPLPVPEPFDRILLEHLQGRPNLNTSANKASTWLFPGTSPGRHLTASFLMIRLRKAGIEILGAKNAALRTLVLEMPAAIVANAFGYSNQVIDLHATTTGKKWSIYAAFGTDTPPPAG